MSARFTMGATVAILCCTLSACASISDDATNAATDALRQPSTTTTIPPTTTTNPNCTETTTQPDPRALLSFAPNGVSTDASKLNDPIIANIRKRGFVAIGVDENTRDFSALDPITGQITGLEVDIAKEIAGPIAQAVFGDAAKIQPITVSTDQKVRFAADGTVDFTISAVSMTCARKRLVDFSSEYFTAQHRLLVPSNSPITGLQDLAGKTVCVTAGSSSATILTEQAKQAIQKPMVGRTDCLRALQAGTVDAYFSHDSILRSMQQQDPNLVIVGNSVAPQHYGIAVAKGHEAFVRYINAVLERMRTDSSENGLAALYLNWLKASAPPIPPARYQDGA